VRDMPDDAQVHISAIRRMETVPTYRPGNLIVGGGGRGFIVAPKEKGIGEWLPAGYQGDLVRERVIRKPKEETEKKSHGQTNEHKSEEDSGDQVHANGN
jgi:hypothetical protein